MFRPMIASKTNLKHKHTAILSVILLAVIASGCSQIELHTHSAADFGHVHDAHDHDGVDGTNAGDVDEPGNTGAMHAHDIGAPALALVPIIDLNVVAHLQAEGSTPPPTAKPPDKLIKPLHRPPIV